MIIDVHYHLMPAVNKPVVENLSKFLLQAAKSMGRTVNIEEIEKRALETWADPTGERLIADMDAAGIDFTVICMVDNAANEAITSEMTQRANKIIGDVAKRYPKRIMGLAGVDPRRPEASDMMRQCFEEFGVKGLKYHPDYGYDPAGPESYKVLEIVVKNRGILLTHTGPLMPPARCKFSEPMMLADLAVDFPELNVIAAHMGLINWRPWASLAAYQSTLYGDLAMWDIMAFGRYDFFCRELRNIIDSVGVSKVLFGTDGPILPMIEPAKNMIRLLKDLSEKAPEGIQFTKEEIDAILGGNAAAILGLK
jgi:predicted TIM-barrel fold metal-dependent hydrolase